MFIQDKLWSKPSFSCCMVQTSKQFWWVLRENCRAATKLQGCRKNLFLLLLLFPKMPLQPWLHCRLKGDQKSVSAPKGRAASMPAVLRGRPCSWREVELGNNAGSWAERLSLLPLLHSSTLTATGRWNNCWEPRQVIGQGTQCVNSKFSLRKARAPEEPPRGLRRAAPRLRRAWSWWGGSEGSQTAFHHGKEHGGERTGLSSLCCIQASLATILSVSTFLHVALLGHRQETRWEGKSLDKQHRSATRAREREKNAGQGRYLLHCCCFQTCHVVKGLFKKSSRHSL